MADAQTPAQGGTLQKVTSFFAGIGAVTDQVAGIVDTGADMAEDVARGRGALHQERLEVQERELDMALSWAQFARGDNVKLYWVMGAAAVALILLTMGK